MKDEELREKAKLKPVEIGDNLDLEGDAEYPCSDGGKILTLGVDEVLEAQLAKALPIILAEGERRERERLDNYLSRHILSVKTDLPRQFSKKDLLEALKEGK